ncbi:Geranylgeranyl transferase type-2 subunit alpha 1 [Camellia lanceoleosa]|uniref:Geranylgeranyl transferase type-2 subunit alpha 1 n=1 Tax=Camellia lanceoleosa TaxID=1840588 RepID=A0ACC0FYE6_9ERIC|nr:Geranylgeranyl transferase type-2 subunit alpha 1 [Camellia lanceoleosa]
MEVDFAASWSTLTEFQIFQVLQPREDQSEHEIEISVFANQMRMNKSSIRELNFDLKEKNQFAIQETRSGWLRIGTSKSMLVLDCEVKSMASDQLDQTCDGNFCYTKEALEVNVKLLEANLEFLTAWNYIKFAIEHILSHSETDTEIDPDFIKSIYSEELRVRALAKNYRSYGAWYHHKWVLSKGHSSVDEELQLLAVFLKKDSRNFHAWNYRRFVAAFKNGSMKRNYTSQLI